MGERSSYPHGTFSWVDLSTSDAEAAKRFYGDVFGWACEDMPAGDGMTYSMARLDGRYVGAIFKGDGTLPVHWNSYVTVDDVDAMPERVKSAGGQVMAEPLDVFEAGRMMVLQDPAGAFLNLWQAKDHIGSELVNVPGALTWNDLNTTDPEAAEAFYSEIFGWSFEKVPGDFPYWVIANGGRSNGGMRRLDPEREAGIPSHWLPYFAAEDTDAARARVEELGGRTFFGPMEVPSGGRFVVVQDPQGGVFALFSGEFDD